MIERGPFVLYFIILFVFLWLPCFIPSFTQGGLRRARFQNPARGFRPKILDRIDPSSNPSRTKKKKKRRRDFYLGGRHHGARGAEGHSQRHWLSKRFRTRWRLPWRPHREREACSSIGRGATGPPSAGPMLPARLRRRRPRGSARGEPTRSPSPQARGLMGPQPQDQTSRWRPPAGAEPPPW